MIDTMGINKNKPKKVILYLEYWKKLGPKCHFWAGFGQNWLKLTFGTRFLPLTLNMKLLFGFFTFVIIVSTILYTFAARNWSYVSLIAEYIDIWVRFGDKNRRKSLLWAWFLPKLQNLTKSVFCKFCVWE